MVKNWAEEARERVQVKVDAETKEIEAMGRKYAEEFAKSISTYKVTISQEEATAKWQGYYMLVIKCLEEEGFIVNRICRQVRKGFMGLKKEDVFFYEISCMSPSNK